jgi:GNAT superfamily N-acetyltransferase
MTELNVRAAEVEDVPALLPLMDAHARYENAAAITNDAKQRLPALVRDKRDNWIFLLQFEGAAIGYAAFNLATSTWRSERYLHMDCLYIDESCRGKGGGKLLFDAGMHLAHSLGMSVMEWQTPANNHGAIRFYERLGAQHKEKLRFSVAIN